jgi:hypothetical protein
MITRRDLMTSVLISPMLGLVSAPTVVLLSKRDFSLFMMRQPIIGYSGAIDLIYT